MGTIKTYLDNVFAAFPQSEAVAKLKREMLADMEEKYSALKNEGKSENEAIGSVIANFGNIDEIVNELGLNGGNADSNGTPAASNASPTAVDDTVYLSREEAYEYISFTKKCSIAFGIGVWLILTGVSAMLLIGDKFFGNGLGIIALFVAIIPAVGLFIIYGMKFEKYEAFENKTIALDTQTSAEIEQLKSKFVVPFTGYIIGGISSVLLAVGLLLLTDSVPLMLFIIGFGVLLFIAGGMLYGAYDMLLNRGDYAKGGIMIGVSVGGVNAGVNLPRGTKKSERLIATVAAVFWPLIVAVYLLWSFIGDAWHISWLVWPIAGVLFGAFAGGVSVWNETE